MLGSLRKCARGSALGTRLRARAFATPAGVSCILSCLVLHTRYNTLPASVVNTLRILAGWACLSWTQKYVKAQALRCF